MVAGSGPTVLGLFDTPEERRARRRASSPAATPPRSPRGRYARRPADHRGHPAGGPRRATAGACRGRSWWRASCSRVGRAIVYGSGVVDPPNIEELLLDLGDALGKWSYLLVGALAFLETGAFVGLVAPGETAVIAGGVFAGQGNLELAILLPLVWLCCVAGDCVSFWLGRRLGRGFLLEHGPKVKITEERLVQVEDFFARRGGVTILIGRFIGLVRALAPFVAGASKMPFRKFLPYDIVGCGLWSTTFVAARLLLVAQHRQAPRRSPRGARSPSAPPSCSSSRCGSPHRFLRTPEQRDEVRRWWRERRGGDAVEPTRHNEQP